LDSLGAAVQISEVLPEGRAALSQGMVETAARRALAVARYLETKTDGGWVSVVPEPSVLALFRRDYKNLLKDDHLFEKIRKSSFGAVEYLISIFSRNKINPKDVFDVDRSPFGKRLFFHGHCQRKSLNGIMDEVGLFKAIGFDVQTSNVECCGMAGSFGYKREFYEVSMRIGEELFRQIREADGNVPRTLVSSGISCRHQIEEGVGRHVLHPMEVLEKVMVR